MIPKPGLVDGWTGVQLGGLGRWRVNPWFCRRCPRIFWGKRTTAGKHTRRSWNAPKRSSQLPTLDLCTPSPSLQWRRRGWLSVPCPILPMKCRPSNSACSCTRRARLGALLCSQNMGIFCFPSIQLEDVQRLANFIVRPERLSCNRGF
jgi:hypothetical protein